MQTVAPAAGIPGSRTCIYVGTLSLWTIVFQWDSGPGCMAADKAALLQPDESFARPVEHGVPTGYP